ncbi:MAG: hypothetical protein WCJ02_12890, partial [bacterium]
MKHIFLAGTAVLALAFVFHVNAQTPTNGLGPVRYEDFGAKGDGETDDFEALVNAHAHANKMGLPVKANDSATYYIGGGDRTIVVMTDTDFGKAKFIIDDTHVKNLRADVFDVCSALKPIKLTGVDSLAGGQRRIDVKLPGPCLVFAGDSSTKRFIRKGLNQNNGSPQSDVFLVDEGGNVDPKTPIIWDFKKVTSIEALPLDATRLTLRGGHFTTIANGSESIYRYHARGIKVRRSNVLIEGLEHRVTGEGEQGQPYGGFIVVTSCANVMIKDTVLCGHKTYYTIGSAGKKVSMGSYDISIGRAVNVSLVNVTQTNSIMDRTRWGVIGTNFCKNLSYEGCALSRFDAHQGVTHATIRNSTIGYMGVLLTGFGEFLIENSTVQSNHFIGLRSDYGSTWTGNITIRNCRFVSGQGGVILDGSNDGQHDFGYTCSMPGRLIVDGLKIEDEIASKKGPKVFANFNPRLTSAAFEQPFPYVITREVVLKKITTTSGLPLTLSDNAFMFR